MPSCDGSNCGACNCNCNTVEKIIYKDDPKLLKKLKDLEKEIEKLKKEKNNIGEL